MRRLAIVFSAAALTVLGGVSTMKALTPAPSPLPTATISIQDLHRQVDVKSLPELQIESLY